MNVGGTARYVGELVENIPGSILATGNVQGSEIEDPCLRNLATIRVPSLGRKMDLVNDFRAWAELRKIIKSVQPEIVHTHTFKAGLIGRLVKGPHKKIHTFHGHLFEDQSFSQLQKKIIFLVEKFLAGKTDILVSVGEQVGKEIRTKGIGVNVMWVSIAPGVSPLVRTDRKISRKLLDLGEEGLIFGWMARMAEVKNPNLLLDVANKLPSINFVMAGGGDLFESIKKRAPRNVRLIGWADAGLFWSAVDCAISTSDNEGMPIALIEAQLAGLPVIATNVGSTREIVEDNITGIICNRSRSELVDAVVTLSRKPKIMKLMGAAGKVRSQNEFNKQKMFKSHKAIYSKVLNTAE